MNKGHITTLDDLYTISFYYDTPKIVLLFVEYDVVERWRFWVLTHLDSLRGWDNFSSSFEIAFQLGGFLFFHSFYAAKNLKTMTDYSKIEDPKERLFKIMDRIEELKTPFELNLIEELELRNLEVLKMNAWSAWKD